MTVSAKTYIHCALPFAATFRSLGESAAKILGMWSVEKSLLK